MSFEIEPILKSQSVPAEFPNSKILEETSGNAEKANDSNESYIHTMSTKVADALNNAWTGSDRPAKLLEEALKPLSGQDRNDLLEETKLKNDSFSLTTKDENRKESMQHLQLGDWNASTGTWDNVSIVDDYAPLSGPLRIVQPGNTLGSLAGDRLEEAYDYTHHVGLEDQAGHLRPWSWKYPPSGMASTMRQIAKMNNLGDLDKESVEVKVGQLVRLPQITVNLEP